MKRQKSEAQNVETPLVGVKPPPHQEREPQNVETPLVGVKPHVETPLVGVKPSPQSPEGERLARFLAHAGVASRRHAEELIANGRVQINGVTVGGKTGTAQHGVENSENPYAWFLSYAKLPDGTRIFARARRLSWQSSLI